jgi:hypothetical protein
MEEAKIEESVAIVPAKSDPASAVLFDPTANPFRLVVDPDMRENMREALLKLIDCHDRELAKYMAEGRIRLDSYKEYIELFARSLRECMESREGVAYLMKACGFDVPLDSVNLDPEWRWAEETPTEGAA